MLVAMGLAVVLGVASFLLMRARRFWSGQGLAEEKGWPWVGSFGPLLTQTASMQDIVKDIYFKYPGEPCVGIYEFGKPVLLVRDPQLVQDVLVRDFASFSHNGFEIDPKQDPLFATNPFFISGEKWKKTRARLLPAFSSGRLRSLMEPTNAICSEMVQYVLKENPGALPGGVDVKELCGRLTTEVVSSVAFGVRANSFQDPDAEIRRMGRRLLQPEGLDGYLTTVTFLVPLLRYVIPMRFMAPDLDRFFRGLVYDTVSHREKMGERGNDFLQLLIDLKEKCQAAGEAYDYEEMTGHAITFFTDGSETSSAALAFLLHDLSGQPDAQTRLRQELAKCADLEDVLNCRYLNACLMESLRLHPAAGLMKKKASQEAVLRVGGGEVRLRKGQEVVIPVWGLHTDPELFDRPLDFRPQRFLEGEGPPKGAFLPFGDGPRQCIGMRFAQMQVKLAAAALVKAFHLVRTPKSPSDPVQQDPKSFLLAAKGGLWLDFQPIQS